MAPEDHDRPQCPPRDRVRLLARLSAPATVGMLVLAFYNLTDTIFVGRGVGPLAIAGIAVSFPVQIIAMAFGQTFGVGSASVVARSLGAGRAAEASRTLGNLFTLIVATSATIAVLGSLFLAPLLHLFGATESILPLAVSSFVCRLFSQVTG